MVNCWWVISAHMEPLIWLWMGECLSWVFVGVIGVCLCKFCWCIVSCLGGLHALM